ncbi:hypothetical protein [Kitasatospora indigofera]
MDRTCGRAHPRRPQVPGAATFRLTAATDRPAHHSHPAPLPARQEGNTS